MKVTREQIQSTIKELKKELNENQVKLNGLMALKKENVYLLTFRDEVGESVAHIDEWITALEESVETIKTNLYHLNALVENQYC